jgi:hypothetical protein
VIQARPPVGHPAGEMTEADPAAPALRHEGASPGITSAVASCARADSALISRTPLPESSFLCPGSAGDEHFRDTPNITIWIHGSSSDISTSRLQSSLQAPSIFPEEIQARYRGLRSPGAHRRLYAPAADRMQDHGSSRQAPLFSSPLPL